MPSPATACTLPRIPDTADDLLAATGPAPVEVRPPVVAEPGPEPALSDRDAYVSLLEMVKETLGVTDVTPESMTQIAAQLQKAQSVGQRVETVRAKLAEREDQPAKAQDRANDNQNKYDEMQLDERIALQLAAKLADENRWLKKRLAEANDFEAAYGAVPPDAITRYPENFDELHRRLPELEDAGVTFTGSGRDMLVVNDVDTMGKLASAAWDALLVLADYMRARNSDVFDGSIKQYLEDTPQGYRQMPPNKFGGKRDRADDGGMG